MRWSAYLQIIKSQGRRIRCSRHKEGGSSKAIRSDYSAWRRIQESFDILHYHPLRYPHFQLALATRKWLGRGLGLTWTTSIYPTLFATASKRCEYEETVLNANLKTYDVPNLLGSSKMGQCKKKQNAGSVHIELAEPSDAAYKFDCWFL